MCKEKNEKGVTVLDNRNLCEETEIAIFSDAELSAEQKNHIENCESCRALLSQINDLKKDLGELDMCGIEEGKIAHAVMSEIRDRKVSASMPKFKITHHLGTAAAVVIILVAALMIKNPSETDNFSKSNDENASGIVYDDAAEKINYHVLSNIADTYYENDEAATVAGAGAPEESSAVEEAPKIMMKSARTQAVTTDALDEETEESADSENTVLMYTSDSVIADYAGNMEAEAVLMDEAEEEAVAESEEVADGAVNETIKFALKKEIYIFEGLEFRDGEENFSYNISLINERLSSLYGGKYVVSEEKLAKLGVDNAKLLEFAPTLTEKEFDFYKNILDVFE